MLSLPETSDPNFLQAIRTYAAGIPEPEKQFRKVLKNSSKSKAQRFAALYGVLLRLRREARFPEYVELVRKYEAEFAGEPLYDTFRVTVTKWTADDPRSLREALDPASRALEAFPDEPGVLHSYAELIVSLAELEDKARKADIRKAERSLNRAIALSSDKNANHFSTRARLMILKGDYRTARADVATAIALEDSNSTDFLRRITRYEGIRSMIALRRAYDQFVSKQERLLAELNAFRREQLQMLGLLAAVIALIVGGVTVSIAADPDVAVKLLLLSSGTTALVFGGLASLLARAPWLRTVFAIAIALALIAVAVWFVP